MNEPIQFLALLVFVIFVVAYIDRSRINARFLRQLLKEMNDSKCAHGTVQLFTPCPDCHRIYNNG